MARATVHFVFVQALQEACDYYQNCFGLNLAWRSDHDALLIAPEVCLIATVRTSVGDEPLHEQVPLVRHFFDWADYVQIRDHLLHKHTTDRVDADSPNAIALRDLFGLRWQLLWFDIKQLKFAADMTW